MSKKIVKISIIIIATLSGFLFFPAGLATIWSYKIATLSGNNIYVSNLILCSLSTILFYSYFDRLKSFLVGRVNKLSKDKDARNVIQNLVIYSVTIICVLLILTLGNIPMTVFAVISIPFATAVGFGSRDLINNFLSGIVIIVEKPFKIGDVVEIDKIRGTVLAIGIRTTLIEAVPEGKKLIPNSIILQTYLTNLTLNDHIIGCRTTIKIPKDSFKGNTSIDDIIAKISVAFKKNTHILSKKNIKYYLVSLDNAEYIFEVIYYLDMLDQEAQIVNRAQDEISRYLASNPLNMSFTHSAL
jgi:small-conductance mechanosensitive channel